MGISSGARQFSNSARNTARVLRYDSVEIRKVAKELQVESAKLLEKSMRARALLFPRTLLFRPLPESQ
ncbi:MAG TPA: hypothetical protein VJO35_01645 [Terriglobales bacterium]|nr:hypothetical protein [Terriglobales bacterium]